MYLLKHLQMRLIHWCTVSLLKYLQVRLIEMYILLKHLDVSHITVELDTECKQLHISQEIP